MNKDLLCISPAGASHRLVLLHGWGADAEDLLPLGQHLLEVNSQKIELVAFRAPHAHSQGEGRQWYGLFPMDSSAIPLEIIHLRNRLKALAESGIPLQKTVLLGFSQGGAMALESGFQLPLAGIIGCSAYPHPNWRPPLTRPPVLLTHGLKDEIVPFQAAKELIKGLKINDIEVDLVSFQGGHEISPEVLPRIQLALKDWFI